MLPQLPVRPGDSIDRIIRCMQPYGETKVLKQRQRLSPKTESQKFIYLFHQGEVSVLRPKDYLLLGTAYEPDIYGFAEMFSPMYGEMLRADTNCVYSKVDETKALKLIGEHNLWHDVANVLAFHINKLLCREMQIVNQPSLYVIYNYLSELDNMPYEFKSRTSILYYIQERTGLSRSSVMNAISSLKNRGAIEYSRGGYDLRVIRLPHWPN